MEVGELGEEDQRILVKHLKALEEALKGLDEDKILRFIAHIKKEMTKMLHLSMRMKCSAQLLLTTTR